MGSAHLHTRIADGVGWVTFDRPKVLNAYSVEMREELIAFLRRIEQEETVRCVVLSGAGGNFMAGGDVKSFMAEMAKP